MTTGTRQYTLTEFEHLITLSENADRRLEFVAGEVIEVVSNNYSSIVAARLLRRLDAYVEDHDLGYVTGADGGYQVGSGRYIPDVAFISKTRQPQPSHDSYNPNAPDLAVEVLSPTDDPGDMRIKVMEYVRAGVVVWLVDPVKKRVEVYTTEQTNIVAYHAILDGGGVLPGFRLAVQEIFPD